MHNMDEGWFYEDKGERKRAASALELAGLIESDTLNRSSLVWKQGFDDWQRLGGRYRVASAPEYTEPTAPGGTACEQYPGLGTGLRTYDWLHAGVDAGVRHP